MADLGQAGVATAAPVPEKIDEAFTIQFERESTDYDPDTEIELSSDDCDVIFFSGDRIDMGEAVAETLSLLMNPYPRAPEADRLLREAGVLSEEEAGPFAKLRSEEHTSELKSLMRISYAVFCLKKTTTKTQHLEQKHKRK